MGQPSNWPTAPLFTATVVIRSATQWGSNRSPKCVSRKRECFKVCAEISADMRGEKSELATQRQTRCQKSPLFAGFSRHSLKYLKLLHYLAGAGGFEPPHGGIKIPCLTTWRRPNSAERIAPAFCRIVPFVVGRWRAGRPYGRQGPRRFTVAAEVLEHFPAKWKPGFHRKNAAKSAAFAAIRPELPSISRDRGETQPPHGPAQPLRRGCHAGAKIGFSQS